MGLCLCMVQAKFFLAILVSISLISCTISPPLGKIIIHSVDCADINQCKDAMEDKCPEGVEINSIQKVSILYSCK